MKRSLCVLFLAVMSLSVAAQQRAQYTQYIFNNYLLNPAVSGIENYTDLKGGYRSQWSGLEGAPVTSYISIHAPIGKNFINSSANSFPSDGNNPMSRSFLQTYAAAEPHHGVGLQAVFDETGPLRRTDVSLSYAYHLGVTEVLNVSFGVAAGFSKIDLDISQVNLGENANDPAILASQNSNTKPDLGAGIWIYGPRYFIGVSALQLLGQNLSFTDDKAYDQGKLAPHFFTTAGYKFYLGDDFAAIRSAMIKHVSPAPTSVDLNLKVAFRDKFWLGGGYRVNDSFSAMAGMNISHLFNLSYSYDYTTSGLNAVSSGSHEVVLGLLLNNRYKVTCPQRSF